MRTALSLLALALAGCSVSPISLGEEDVRLHPAIRVGILTPDEIRSVLPSRYLGGEVEEEGQASATEYNGQASSQAVFRVRAFGDVRVTLRTTSDSMSGRIPPGAEQARVRGYPVWRANPRGWRVHTLKAAPGREVVVRQAATDAQADSVFGLIDLDRFATMPATRVFIHPQTRELFQGKRAYVSHQRRIRPRIVPVVPTDALARVLPDTAGLGLPPGVHLSVWTGWSTFGRWDGEPPLASGVSMSLVGLPPRGPLTRLDRAVSIAIYDMARGIESVEERRRRFSAAQPSVSGARVVYASDPTSSTFAFGHYFQMPTDSLFTARVGRRWVEAGGLYPDIARKLMERVDTDALDALVPVPHRIHRSEHPTQQSSGGAPVFVGLWADGPNVVVERGTPDAFSFRPPRGWAVTDSPDSGCSTYWGTLALLTPDALDPCAVPVVGAWDATFRFALSFVGVDEAGIPGSTPASWLTDWAGYAAASLPSTLLELDETRPPTRVRLGQHDAVHMVYSGVQAGAPVTVDVYFVHILSGWVRVAGVAVGSDDLAEATRQVAVSLHRWTP